MDARPAAGTMLQESVKCAVSQCSRHFSPEVEQMRNRAAGNGGETKILSPSKPSGYYMYHQDKYLKKSTFCPHNVFMCFVWI